MYGIDTANLNESITQIKGTERRGATVRVVLKRARFSPIFIRTPDAPLNEENPRRQEGIATLDQQG